MSSRVVVVSDLLYAAADAPGTGADRAPEERGDLHVHDRVVEKIVRHSALEVHGSVVGHSGLAVVGTDYPSVRVDLRAGHAWISVDIATGWPAPLERIAGQVRDRVRERTEALAGVTVERVDVTVHVVEAASSPRRVQ